MRVHGLIGIVTASWLFGSVPCWAQGDPTDVWFNLRWQDIANGEILHKEGTILTWEIEIETAPAFTEGLAGFCVDLVQDASNPALFDIPHADPLSLPLGMEGFSRPEGISNAGESGSPSGYFGVQRGVAGEMDLIQIGGLQNVFGVPGTAFGLDTTLEAGVGFTPIVAVSGSLEMPTVSGEYVFKLANPEALVFEVAPPAGSDVRFSQPLVSLAGISFVSCIGDINSDGEVSLDDLATLLNSYGLCLGDAGYNPDADIVNFDDCVDLSDLSTLLSHYGEICTQ